MTARDPTYTREASAVSLHETFVANVTRLMRERGLVHPPSSGPGKAGKINFPWLVEHADVPRRTVENIMTLSNQPTMVGAARIAAALGTSLDALLSIEDTYTAPSLSRSSELACIHPAAHLPDKFVCAKCLAKWQSYQRRLRELYETQRGGARTEWAAENRAVRKEQTAHLPDSKKENMG